MSIKLWLFGVRCISSKNPSEKSPRDGGNGKKKENEREKLKPGWKKKKKRKRNSLIASKHHQFLIYYIIRQIEDPVCGYIYKIYFSLSYWCAKNKNWK